MATPFGIAVVHSCFNVAATLVLLPFSNGLVKLACLTLPTHEDVKEMSETDKTLSLLDSRFLDTPAYAVEQSRQVASVMADKSRKAMDLAMELLQGYDEAKAEQVAQMETDVDRFEDELGTYLVKLSSRQLSGKDSETLNTILHCIGDFERISDHARNVKEAAQEMYDKKLDFSDKAQEELKVFERAVHDILDITSTTEVLGKPVGSDEKNHKLTYVTLHGIEESKQQVKELSEEAVEILKSFETKNGFLVELVEQLVNREK